MPTRFPRSLPPYAIASVALAAFAVATLPYAHAVLPGLGSIGPAALVVAATAELATFAVLVALYARAPRRSTAFLALTYLAGTLLTIVHAGALPPGPSVPPALRVRPEVATWLAAAWCFGFAVCVAGYAALRSRTERELARAQALRFLCLSAVGFVLGAGAIVGAALAAGRLGPARDGIHLGAGGTLPVAAIVLAACVLATVALLARGVRDGVDGGLVLAAVAITLAVALHFVDDRRYVGAWYVGRILYLAASSFVLVASIRDLLRWRTRALQLEILLAEQLHRGEHHARRLEALWKLASQPALDDDAFLHAVLVASSEGIHPGPQFYGVISHLDGAEIVIDINQECDAIDGALARAARLPVAQTLLAELLRAGKTCSWSDVRCEDALAHVPRVRTMPWRAFVGTPFQVGPTVYFLTFTSQAALVEPFSSEDHAYLEIVASFCSSRLQQRVQFERLRHQSTHDPLTGLPNRAAFRMASARELAAGEPFALAVIDVDRFRSVNERFGHQTADAVLVEVAAAIAQRAGEDDVVARLGGDTFGVLMRGVPARADAERRVERIHGAFAQPFGTGDRDGKQRVAITASIGVASAPADGTAFERLLARADAAVRTSKESGRARWSFFDRSVEDAFARARRLENDLAQALVRGEFVLQFQPHVALASGRVAGAEALIRWNHPERGVLSAADFVPFAEEHGMLGEIGAWVMRETVRASRPWRAVDPAFRMWFNLSARELSDPALVERLHELGDLRGVGVEINESIAMRDVHATMRSIAALREAGLAIALDDFGTGFSSLAHLKRLPVDVLKIDGVFTAGVPDDPHDAAIVEAVLGIAKRYGFATVAEGVETMRQSDYLLAAGCTYAQGFAYAPPLSETAFSVYLHGARNSALAGAYMRA